MELRAVCSGDGGRVVLVQWFKSRGGGQVVVCWSSSGQVVERVSSALIVFILELFKNVNF